MRKLSVRVLYCSTVNRSYVINDDDDDDNDDDKMVMRMRRITMAGDDADDDEGDDDDDDNSLVRSGYTINLFFEGQPWREYVINTMLTSYKAKEREDERIKAQPVFPF